MMNHEYFDCGGTGQACEYGTCMFCCGGLSHCTVCGGFEGTMPTHCPGAQMDKFTADKVWTTDLDFVNGQWIRNPAKHPLKGMTVEETRQEWKVMYEDQDSMGKAKYLRGW